MQKAQGGLGRGLGSLLPVGPSVGSRQSVVVSETVSTPEIGKDIVVSSVPHDDRRPTHDDRVLRLDPNTIVTNPRQPRHHFAPDDLSDLMASVKEHGILQPLVVTKRADGRFELIAGERRLRSARAVGLATVPAVVREANDQQKLELALIENIQRADLNAVEEAKAYRRLMDDFGLTQEDVAGRVGKSRSQIANTLRLLDLPTDMLAAVVDGRITKSHARTLLAESNDDRRRELFEKMLGGGVTVRRAEQVVGKGQGGVGKDPNIAALEVTLREKLGTKVTINVKGAESTIAIHCYSKDDLAEMIRRLTE